MEFVNLVLSQDVTMAFVAFAFIYISDILLGLINNVLIKGQKFEWKRLLDSIIKVIVGALVLVALIFAVFLFEKTDVNVSQEVINVVSISTFVMLFWKGYKEGMVGIYEKLREMFSISDDNANSANSQTVDPEVNNPADYMGPNENEMVYEFKDGGKR